MNSFDQIRVTLDARVPEFAATLQFIQQQVTKTLLHQTLIAVPIPGVPDVRYRQELTLDWARGTCLSLGEVEYGL